jgi:hypothetical protein
MLRHLIISMTLKNKTLSNNKGKEVSVLDLVDPIVLLLYSYLNAVNLDFVSIYASLLFLVDLVQGCVSR